MCSLSIRYYCNQLKISCLECEQEEEGHHEAEKTHGLGEGKAKNGIREQLLLEGGVPGIADDEGSENGSNSSSGSCDTDGGSAGADELGRGVDVRLGGRGGKPLRGLDGGRAHAPHGGKGEAGGEGEASNGGHSADEN